MPTFTYTALSSDDKSSLSTGMHPAFLVDIAEEPTPPQWEMAKKSPIMFRWRFLVWESIHALTTGQPPERQSMVSSPSFTPAGRYQASKAYQWVTILMGHEPGIGEQCDLTPLLPIPCQVMVLRTDNLGKPTEFANLTGLFAWAEGQAYRTPEFCAKLAHFLAQPITTVPGQTGANTPAPRQAPVASPPPAVAPSPAPPGWAAPAQQPLPNIPATTRW